LTVAHADKGVGHARGCGLAPDRGHGKETSMNFAPALAVAQSRSFTWNGLKAVIRSE
jgi:hypothetical protein